MTSRHDPVKNEKGTDDGTLELAVIIPTLNAAAGLGPTIAALGPVRRLLVVDGGSTDSTLDLAASLAAEAMRAPKGRGQQLGAGIEAVGSGWMLLLHADTQLEPAWRQAARDHIDGDTMQAGYFRFGLDSAAPQARRLERAVAWRCRTLGLPYGDQGLLVHADLLNVVGGMRPLPLMEDVDLVRRIGRHRLRALAPRAITSARKWERDGWHRRSARNLMCLTLWFLGLPPRLIARLYG